MDTTKQIAAIEEVTFSVSCSDRIRYIRHAVTGMTVFFSGGHLPALCYNGIAIRQSCQWIVAWKIYQGFLRISHTMGT